MFFFAAFCSNPIIFWRRDQSESILHDKLSWYTKFGSKQYISSKVMLFAANHVILQHFAATWQFFEKDTYLNLLYMINYLCIQSSEVIKGLVPKICHLLQIILRRSILQQPDNSWNRLLSESTPHDKLFLCTKFGSNECIRFQIILLAANHVILQHFAATW